MCCGFCTAKGAIIGRGSIIKNVVRYPSRIYRLGGNLRLFSRLRQTVDKHGIVRVARYCILSILGLVVLSAAVIVNKLLITLENNDIEHILMYVRFAERSDVKAHIGRIRAPIRSHSHKARVIKERRRGLPLRCGAFLTV